MKEKKVGKLTLALTLISIGMILLFRNDINLSEVLKLYVPIVLVFLGLEIVLSKLYYEKKDYHVKIDLGSVVFVVLIVLTLAGAIFSFNTYKDGKTEFAFSGFNLFNSVKYNNRASVTNNIEIESSENLYLETDYSDLEIIKTEEKTIRVEGTVEYRYNDDSKRELKLEDIMKTEKSPDTTSLTYSKEDAETNHDIGIESLNYKVYVPEDILNAKLDISYSKADLKNLNLQALEINSDYSDIYLNDISGEMSITSNYGSIEKNRNQGDVRIDSRYTDVNIKDSIGNVSIKADYGEIEVENLNKSLVANINYCDLSLKNSLAIEDELRITGSYSDVNLDLLEFQEGRFNITANPGDIDLGKFEDKDNFEIRENTVTGAIGNANIPVVIDLRMGDISFE